MFLKKKHILVIIFSSLIITVVFVSTLIGYSLYIQWKKDSFALRYRNSIYKLTAELFRKDVITSNMSVKIGGKELFPGLPLLEGSLKNNSNKTVTSVMVEVYFLRPDGTVVYKDWFYPLGEQHFGSPALLPGIKQTRNILLPGEGISFRHLLRNCPRELVEQVSVRTKLAKNSSKDRIKMVYSIVGLSVL
ncbi:MAG: hypothetical protein ABID83_04845 [Candidatus Omnitrophota bacterium]